MHTRFRSVAVRACALIVTCALLGACTRAVPRAQIETRHVRVDWDRSGTEILDLDGLQLRGIILTPAQWPLEGSIKRLLTGDFIGIVDALDLRFHSSTLPDGVLRDVYDSGYVPAYVRVTNPGPDARVFSPVRLQVQAEPRIALDPVRPENVPYFLRRIDWERTALPIVSALVIVAAAVAARESRLDARVLTGVRVDVGVILPREEGREGGPGGEGLGFTADHRTADPGLLRAGPIGPQESREGIVFFSHRGQMVDWKTARLAAP